MSNRSSNHANRACARAPFRVDPAGGGTDAPPFCIDHGGAVVNYAVGRHAFATAQRLLPGQGVIIYSMDASEGGVADRPEDLGGSPVLSFLRAFVARLVPKGDSLLLLTQSDVPQGSGLGGSGALGVAIVAAIDTAYGRQRSAEETAELANSVERCDLGFPGGNQDSYGSAVGGIKLIEYPQGGGTECRQLNINNDTRCSLEHHSLLMYTGASHVSGDIHEDIKRAYERGDEKLMRAMTSLREEAYEMAAGLEAGDLKCYARSLSRCCSHLYDLHDGCDSPDHRKLLSTIDDLILGGKTCGAGGGGFLLVFAKPGCRRACWRKAEELGALVWPMTIDLDGMKTWSEPTLNEDQVKDVRKKAENSVSASSM